MPSASVSFKLSSTPRSSSSKVLLFYINSIVALPVKSADPPYGLSFKIVTCKLDFLL